MWVRGETVDLLSLHHVHSPIEESDMAGFL